MILFFIDGIPFAKFNGIEKFIEIPFHVQLLWSVVNLLNVSTLRKALWRLKEVVISIYLYLYNIYKCSHISICYKPEKFFRFVYYSTEWQILLFQTNFRTSFIFYLFLFGFHRFYIKFRRVLKILFLSYRHWSVKHLTIT